MATKTFTNVSVGAAAAGLAATVANAADPASVEQLLARIKDSDDTVRHTAWIDAGRVGSAAVKPLAATMTHNDLEVARAARHALWTLVRHAGRPGADRERRAAVGELAGRGLAQHEAFLVGADGEPHDLFGNIEKRRVECAEKHDRPFDQSGDFIGETRIVDQLQAVG